MGNAIDRHSLSRTVVVAAALAAGCAVTQPPAQPETPPLRAEDRPVPTPRAEPPQAAEPVPAPPQASAEGEPGPAAAPPLPPPDLRIVLASSAAALQDRDIQALRAIADRSRNGLGISVSVESYSSWHGSRELNMALAQQRADEVKATLVKLGVPPGRVRTTAYGEERARTSPAQRSRIDIRVMDAGG